MEKMVEAMQDEKNGVRIFNEKKLIGPDMLDVTQGISQFFH